MMTPPDLPSRTDSPSPAPIAPPAAQALSPVPTPIDEDLPCLRCGRNLLGSLPSDQCPGCGIPVLHSIEFERRQLAVPPTRLALAAALFSADALVGVGASAMELLFEYLGLFERNQSLSTVMSLAELVLMLLLVLPANFLLWQLGPPLWRRPSRAIPYLGAMIAYLASTILVILAWLVLYGMYTRGSYSLYMPMTTLMYVMGALQTASAIMMMVFVAIFLHGLSKRPAYRMVRHWILPVFGLLILLSLAVIMEQVYWLYFLLERSEGDTSLMRTIWHWTSAARLLLDAASLVLWITVGVLAVRRWRAIRTLPPTGL